MQLHRISAGKYRRYRNQRHLSAIWDIKTFLLNLRDLFRFALGFFQSLWHLLRLRPDRVFIKGGYVGLPVGLAAWCLRIPLIIHESDSVPGLTNRILGRLTPYKLAGFQVPEFLEIGNPVREEIIRPASPQPADFGIRSGKPVVLVFGGSLGSESINQVIYELAGLQDEFEIIHIYGRAADQNKLPTYPQYHPYQFLTDQMAAALQLADVVITRAGANTLAELAALGKPSIIVPHPHLQDQPQNAAQWSDALVVLEQSQLSADRLYRHVSRIIDDDQLRGRLSEAISRRARPQAAADIAEYIAKPQPVVET